MSIKNNDMRNPKTDYKKWDTPPKIEPNEVITTCVSVLASAFEDEPFQYKIPIVFPIPDPCKNCSNHPSNGGTGICFCTLGTPKIT